MMIYSALDVFKPHNKQTTMHTIPLTM